jgi:hypothetical protein
LGPLTHTICYSVASRIVVLKDSAGLMGVVPMAFAPARIVMAVGIVSILLTGPMLEILRPKSTAWNS